MHVARAPVSLLFPDKSADSDGALQNDIAPVNKLLLSFSSFSPVNRPMELGRVPDSKFEWRSSAVRAVMAPIALGRVPVKKAPLLVARLSRFDSNEILIGIVP